MSGRSPRAPAERATSNVTPSAEPAELEPGKLYAIHLPGPGRKGAQFAALVFG